MFKKTIMTTLLSSAILFAESGGGLNINEKDLELEAVLDSRNLEAFQTTSTIFQAEANFLNIDEKAKSVGVGVGATNKFEGIEGVELTLGAKFVWAEVGSNDDFTALPLMAKVRYNFPPLMFNIPPVSVEGKVLYAPKVLAFGDSESYREFRLNAEMEMIKNVKVYTGYRNIQTEYKGIANTLFDTGFYGGLRFSY
jgi:hypothetical protein